MWYSKRTMHTPLVRFLFLAIVIYQPQSYAGSTSGISTITELKEATLSGIIGDEITYHFTVEKDQVVLVEVEQQVGDLVLVLSDQNYQQILKVDIPVDHRDKETMLVDSIQCRSCFVSVLPVTAPDRSGRYTIKLSPLEGKDKSKKIRVEKTMTLAANRWANASEKPEELRVTLSLYEQAILLWRTLGDTENLNRSYHLAYMVSYALNDKKKQVIFLNKLIEQGDKEVGKRGYTTLARFNMSDLLFSQGRLVAAKTYINQAEKMSIQQGNQLLRAKTLVWKGFLATETGQQFRASELFKKATQIYVEQGDMVSMVETMNLLGWSYHRQGKEQTALNTYLQAHELAALVRSDDLKSMAETGLGSVYGRLGDVDRSLSYLNQVLSRSKDIHYERIIGNALQEKGKVLFESGRHELAQLVFKKALQQYLGIGSKSDEINTLFHLGKTHKALKQYDQALEYYKRVLAYDITSGNEYNQGLTNHVIAEVLMLQKSYDEALRHQKQAIEFINSSDDNHSKGRANSQLGELYFHLGRYDDALTVLAAAEAFQQESGDFLLKIRTGFRLARIKAGQKEFPAALKLIDTVRADIETQMKSISRADLRRSYIALQRDVVEFYLSLLHKLGQPEEALQIAEEFRARTLQEALRQANSFTLDPEKLARREALMQTLQSISADYRQLSDKNSRQVILQRIQDISSQIEEVNVEIYKTPGDTTNNKVANNFELAAFQASLNSHTMALVYFTGQEHNWLWWVSKDHVGMLELETGFELQDQVKTLLGMISNNPGERKITRWQQQKEIKQLSLTLMGQLKDRPEIDLSNVWRLLIVPDGPLNYLPFSALTQPGSDDTLIEKYDLIYAASLSVQMELGDQPPSTVRKKEAGGLLVLADPTISKQTVIRVDVAGTIRETVLKELPYSGDEARAISAIVKDQATLLLGEKASKQTLLTESMDNYSMIHFATHALANRTEPALSGLVLSGQGGIDSGDLLSIPEISQMSIPVELTVLSGCETAIGQNLEGEGLMGLSRAFFEAGSKRVLASLWPVQDKATSELMAHFYQALLKEKQSPATALRQAQRHISSQRQWRDPYYWAGFILQGEDRSWFD